MSHNRKSYKMREFSGKDGFEIWIFFWGHLIRLKESIRGCHAMWHSLALNSTTSCYAALTLLEHYSYLVIKRSSTKKNTVIVVYMLLCVRLKMHGSTRFVVIPAAYGVLLSSWYQSTALSIHPYRTWSRQTIMHPLFIVYCFMRDK